MNSPPAPALPPLTPRLVLACPSLLGDGQGEIAPCEWSAADSIATPDDRAVISCDVSGMAGGLPSGLQFRAALQAYRPSRSWLISAELLAADGSELAAWRAGGSVYTSAALSVPKKLRRLRGPADAVLMLSPVVCPFGCGRWTVGPQAASLAGHLDRAGTG